MNNEEQIITSPETPSENNPDSKWKPLFFGILALLAIGFVAGSSFLLGSRKTAEPSPSPSPSPTTLGITQEVESTPTSTPKGKAPTSLPSPAPIPTPTSTPTATPIPTPTPMADLYINEYSFDHPPKQDEAFTVRIGIYNQGNKKAEAFWWEWWPTKYNYACRQRISEGIAAHGGRIVTCPYTYGGWANYETKAVADTDNEVSESDETNNSHVQMVIPIH